jgi:hypothetical protein
VNNKQLKKEREKRYVEVVRDILKGFPNGQLIADEHQERPDVLVLGTRGRTGVEVTRILHQSLKRTESEREAVVSEACRLYERKGLPHLHISVHLGAETAFNRRNRNTFATALADIVAANVPGPNDWAEVVNNWENPQVFPYEIHSVQILRNRVLSRNYWTIPTWGWIMENFTEKLQEVITSKESRIRGYDSECNELWLLVVAENSTAAAGFDPSESTLAHPYVSSFNRVFFLDLFKREIFELKLERPVE